MANIKIENLCVIFEQKRKEPVVAIDNLNLEIKDNSLNVILGYSGCGKTTLLRCIAGFQDYDGMIYLNGKDTYDMPIKEKNIAMVTQTYALYKSMTVFENIAFPLTMTGASKEEIIERVYDVAKKLGIEHCLSRKPKQISGGQKQRVALARALIKKPNLYLFDEPLSNFDAKTRFESRVLIKKIIKETGATALYVTHDFYEAMDLADHLIVMNNGKVEIEGTSREVFNSKNPVVESLKGETLDDIIQ